jgi:hypothetical protein
MGSRQFTLYFAAISLALCGWSTCVADSFGNPTHLAKEPAFDRPLTNTKEKPDNAAVTQQSTRLDLRPPDLIKETDLESSSANMRFSGSENSVAINFGHLAKPLAPAEEFARRVHREGLPVARLFESKTALISLGLNPKGKPGLWLTQKIH